MNIKNTVTIEESLKSLTNSTVVVKLNNGRVISGFLKEAEENYTIKLGVKHIEVGVFNVVKVVPHP